jgi:hypothetical protein
MVERQQSLQSLISKQSSLTSISCKSSSISGRYSTGRHTDRNKGIQSKFKKQLMKRDKWCVAFGNEHPGVAAHIVPLNKSELIPRDMLFSPRNGVLLHQDLEDDYDRLKWIFDADGKVTVLYQNWPFKNTISQVNISKDLETGPSEEFIELHNKMAREAQQHYCKHCWKYVGAVNIENHISGSCENIGQVDGQDDGDDEDI